MKKLLCLLLSLLCLFPLAAGLAACDSIPGLEEIPVPSPTPDDTDESTVTETVEDIILASANYEVSVPMMSYFVYSEYEELVSLYDQYSSQFGISIKIPGGKGGSSLNTAKPLREQTYEVTENPDGTTTTVTWFDRFAGIAEDNCKSILSFCESAHSANVALSDNEKAVIDSEINALKQNAAKKGMSLDKYLQKAYGDSVKESHVRSVKELTSLAKKYLSIREDELYDSITDEQINTKYHSNNHGDRENKYDRFADFVCYSIPLYTGNIPKNELDAVKARYQQLQQQLADCITANSSDYEAAFLAILQDFFYDEECSKALEENNNAPLSDAQLQVCLERANALAAECAQGVHATNQDLTDLSDTQLENLLMHATVLPQANQTFLTQEKDGTVLYYNVYLLKKELHRDEGKIRSVGHILFKHDTYEGLLTTASLSPEAKKLADRVLARNATLSAAEMAKELLTLMQEEGALVKQNGVWTTSAENFEKYGKIYTEDSNVFYNGVSLGEMVAEFENWLFDKHRTEGEISYPQAVETEYGYHIMLYTGNEMDAWAHGVRSDIFEELYKAWVDEVMDGQSFTYNESFWEKIS